MKGLIPTLNTDLPVEADSFQTEQTTNDALGQMLQTKWDTWSQSRRSMEEEWLRDLRAFNQKNEPDATALSHYHSHVYPGITRTKCMSAFARINDLLFGNTDKHWGIESTPIPGDLEANLAKMQAEAMETEIEDQLVDMRYEDHLKAAILEGVIIGTGVVKGAIPGVKTSQKWGKVDDVVGWEMTIHEYPFPEMASPSIFNVVPDPYATIVDDLSGVFERHTKNRQQFTELKLDPKFDKKKIDEILRQTDKGNHIALYHETERRTIAGISDTTASSADRYDLLEYWGQVSGQLLAVAGVSEVDDSETYWANVWTCESKTLFARIVPMAKQRIPYNFFVYNKIPHQFYGIGVGGLARNSQLCANGSIRAMLDGMALASIPMAEVNVTMLKQGTDPSKLLPGQIFLRDHGDPSVPAVRFFQPQVPTNNLMQMSEMFKQSADDETAIPAYTYGDGTKEINKTAQGMSMQMGAAAMPMKQVVKNLEDGCIKPFIESLYDWNMQWSDNEEIKGDLDVVVLGSSKLIAKEVKSQRLLQFLGITNNPIDMQFVDRKFLLTEAANCLELNAEKVVPDELPQQNMPQQEPNPLDMARAQLIQAQALLTQMQSEKAKVDVDLTIAKTAAENVRAQYAANQTSLAILSNPSIIPTTDSLLESAGYADHNGAPVATVTQPEAPLMQPDVPTNTSPAFPPVPQEPDVPAPGIGGDKLRMPLGNAGSSPMTGIETMRNEFA
jgi:hypothetical protein